MRTFPLFLNFTGQEQNSKKTFTIRKKFNDLLGIQDEILVNSAIILKNHVFIIIFLKYIKHLRWF